MKLKNKEAIILDCPQGSESWLDARTGVITMSHAKELLTGGRGATKQSYLFSVAAERITGVKPCSYNSRDMERGIELELYARRAFEQKTGLSVTEVGGVYKDATRRVFASPDGVIKSENAGIEIKCPQPKEHMNTIIEHQGQKHAPQMQGGMYVTGCLAWYFVSYCPEFGEKALFIKEYNRDAEMIEKIDKECREGCIFIDEIIKEAGVLTSNFKALSGINSDALEHLSILLNEGDVLL